MYQTSYEEFESPLNKCYILNINRAVMTSPDHLTPKFGAEDFSHISEQEIATGDKLNITKYRYKDPDGVERICEGAGRCLKYKSADADCAGTLAVLRRMLKYDCLVLVKQYRPPLKAFTLELPAGLANSVESSKQTAVRELKEETGYTYANVKNESPVIAMDPGLSNCTMKVFNIEIDGDNPANKIPMQKPEDEENVEVVHIPIDDLLQRLHDYSEHGVIIDSRVYCFALGHAMGSKRSLCNNRMTLDIE